MQERTLRLRKWADKWRMFTPEIALLESLVSAPPANVLQGFRVRKVTFTSPQSAAWSHALLLLTHRTLHAL